MAGIPGIRATHLLQRFACPDIRIVEDRRGSAGGMMVYGEQISAVADVTIAGGTRNRLLVLAKMLGKRGVHKLHHRYVQTVQPENGPVAFVAVIVPRHRRR